VPPVTPQSHNPASDPPPPPPDAGLSIAPGVLIPSGALTFRAVRSPGPGGQNVNKRSTKIELRVPLSAIPISPAALQRLRAAAGWRINSDDELIVVADDERTQLSNRDLAAERLIELIRRAMIEPKKRYKTKPTKGSQRRRIESKKRTSEKKQSRRKTGDD
jgi:ribosome-associated protein